MLTVAGVTAIVMLAATALTLALTDHEQRRMDAFGAAAAHALSQLAAEPLMRRDRMHLGVIGNRLAEAPEISGVASYTPDDRVLASTGSTGTPRYEAPVTVDGNVVGHVRVTLDAAAFAEGSAARALALVAIAMLTPLLVATGWALARAFREDRLPLVPPRPSWLRLRRSVSATDDPATAPAAPPPDPAPDIRHYLLAVNLYNQLTLDPTHREFELSLCTELAEAVAEVHHGQVVALPGTGILVDFDHMDTPDRAFDVVCAAFTLIRLLHDEAPFGHYRLGMNMTQRPADEALPLDDPVIADAALLSALGKDGSLAVAAPLVHALGDAARLTARPLANPLLDELTTSTRDCMLVTGVCPPHAAAVVEEAEALKAQREATSNPSTF